MSTELWLVMCIVLLIITIFVCTGIVIYTRVMNKIKNGLVLRILREDNTIDSYRYDNIPIDNIALIIEKNHDGKEDKFPYNIRSKCIYSGRWGKYIDYHYHISEPIDHKEERKDLKGFVSEMQDLFKLIGGFLDTDLYVKLMRNQKFEEFVKLMITLIMVFSVIILCITGTTLIKGFITKSDNTNNCVLKLDNITWQTIYIASHNNPLIPQGQPQQ